MRLGAVARLDLLILDDWGPEPLDADQRRDLLEIVEDRYEARSIIVTSQLPVDAGFRSEYPAGFKFECMAGFVGTRTPLHYAATRSSFSPPSATILSVSSPNGR